MYDGFDFQRQNVERAKLALLTDRIDGPSDPNDGDRQSDHLVMMTAYRKWEKILCEVSECLPYLY
jgi:ATP-dependent RNA helicase DHX29